MKNDIKDVWGLDPNLVEEAGSRTKMKHGMFASVPLICKDLACPYSSICTIPENKRLAGKRCAMEAGAIVARFDTWCQHFKIEFENGFVRNEDIADVSLIKDLVENEVQTIRAENRLAISGDFIGKTIVEVDRNCKVHTEDTVTPEAEYKLSLQEKRYKILQLLNATRKDKNDSGLNQNLGESVNSVFKQVQEAISKSCPDLEDVLENLDVEV